jgi:hypothetical protein
MVTVVVLITGLVAGFLFGVLLMVIGMDDGQCSPDKEWKNDKN